VRYTFFLIILLFNNLASGQIVVDRGGDGWGEKIDSALLLIKKYDPEKYKLLDSVCSRISIWGGTFSSTEDSSILISSSDFKLNSLNNIACAIIHESLHLYFEKCRSTGSCRLPNNNIKEEELCYLYEYDFFCKLRGGEDWLELHILREIERFSE
jgi:hypothetical protein